MYSNHSQELTIGVRPVEICGKVRPHLKGANTGLLRACSNCAGDYEDPDRTAPPGAEQVGQCDDEGADECDVSHKGNFPRTK